jgi:hypothetical protein
MARVAAYLNGLLLALNGLSEVHYLVCMETYRCDLKREGEWDA